MNTIFVTYEMEPIGVNGALEAVARHSYCSIDCRDLGNRSADGPVTFETLPVEDADLADGAVCDYCGKVLEEWSGSPCTVDPDGCWIDDITGEHVNARTGARTAGHPEFDGCEFERRDVHEWYCTIHQVLCVGSQQEPVSCPVGRGEAPIRTK